MINACYCALADSIYHHSTRVLTLYESRKTDSWLPLCSDKYPEYSPRFGLRQKIPNTLILGTGSAWLWHCI